MPDASVYTVPVADPAAGLPATSVPPLLTWSAKSEATLVPPLSFTTCLITRRVPSGRTTSKHSVVRFVWLPGEYCANRSGLYCARKQ